MERILFGDNQFFGVNHMSEEKARAQAMQFRDTPSIMRVLDCAYDHGIKVFMCTTHDRIASLILIGLGMIATIGMAARGGSSPGFSPPPPPLPPPSLSITTVSLPDGMVIFSYTQTIRAAGGVAPFTWTISSGNLPHSLTFAANAIDSATITGTYSPWPLEQANAWRLF